MKPVSEGIDKEYQLVGERCAARAAAAPLVLPTDPAFAQERKSRQPIPAARRSRTAVLLPAITWRGRTTSSHLDAT
jgi:hypothetical protein